MKTEHIKRQKTGEYKKYFQTCIYGYADLHMESFLYLETRIFGLFTFIMVEWNISLFSFKLLAHLGSFKALLVRYEWVLEQNNNTSPL